MKQIAGWMLLLLAGCAKAPEPRACEQCAALTSRLSVTASELAAALDRIADLEASLEREQRQREEESREHATILEERVQRYERLLTLEERAALLVEGRRGRVVRKEGFVVAVDMSIGEPNDDFMRVMPWAELAHLESVDLRAATISDDAVLELMKAKKLTTVDIRGASLSDKGVAILKVGMGDKCKVLTFR